MRDLIQAYTTRPRPTIKIRAIAQFVVDVIELILAYGFVNSLKLATSCSQYQYLRAIIERVIVDTQKHAC